MARTKNRRSGPIRRTPVTAATDNTYAFYRDPSPVRPSLPQCHHKRRGINPSQPEWRTSPYYATHATVDRRWNDTTNG